MKDYLYPILIAGTILACGAVSYFFGYEKGYRNAPIKEKTDTVTVTETLTVYEPKETVKYKDRLVYVPVADSVKIEVHDTTYVAVQSERKVYEDKNYRAVISGVYPKLEEISVYPETKYITNTVVKEKKFGFGISFGLGAVYDFGDGKLHGGPAVAGGFTYNF